MKLKLSYNSCLFQEFCHCFLFRIDKQSVCAHGTIVSNGLPSISARPSCIDNPPSSDTWFDVKVKVGNDGYVKTYLDNREVLKFLQQSRVAFEGTKVGVVIANGHIGVLRFKNFWIKKYNTN